MQRKTFLVLEFNKVLENLAKLASSESGEAACLAIAPFEKEDEATAAAFLFEEASLWREQTRFSLSSFPDISSVLEFVGKTSEPLELDGLWALRSVLTQVKEVRESFDGSGQESRSKNQGQASYLNNFFFSFQQPVASTSALLRCISDDALLRDDSSPELARVRAEVRSIHQTCTRKVKEFAKSHHVEHYLQEDFITLSSDRYVLPFKSNFKGHMEGIIHDYSQTGETCYFEPFFLVALNNKLQELKREEREEERKVLRYLTDTIRLERDHVLAACKFLTDLDVLLAKCKLADMYDGRMVNFSPEGLFFLHRARHPLLAMQNAKSVVPVDIELTAAQRALIISGGNAGGKTVSLKTAGLVSLMVLCGLPVPVDAGSYMPFWQNVFAFIGDEQSLDEHLSTYTAQIEHLSAIWDDIGKNSLVILDEFGAGTDPTQGSALAQAVVDEILQKGAFVIAATHFPAFKTYALSRDDIRAGSVIFDERTKKPLYTLVYDQVGASLALEVAKEHGLPDTILSKAEKYLLLEDKEAEVLVNRLNSLAIKKEEELAQLKEAERRFDEERQKLKEVFEKKRRILLQQIDAEKRKILGEIKAGRITKKEALKELSTTRQKLATVGEDAVSDENQKKERLEVFETLNVGDTVVYIPWGREGILEDIDLKKERAKLNFAGIFIWASFNDLELKGGRGQAGAGISASSGFLFKKEAPKEAFGESDGYIPFKLDVRGLRADDAIAELDSFLDSSIMEGREEVEIVHGRGTGALRKEIHLFLNTQKGVESFYTATEEFGGDGVTIVRLR